jgi:hypothetical protein
MLIVHCLKSGSTDILYEYGINPIFRKVDGVERLAAPNQLDSYKDVFSEWVQEHTTSLGKLCAQALADACGKPMDMDLPSKVFK